MCKLAVNTRVSLLSFFIFTVFVNFGVLSLFLGVTVGPACRAAVRVDVEV